jgi:hypothetical protein
MAVPWTPDWSVFFRQMNGAWVSLRIDVGALELAPDPSHPTLALLEFELLNPRADGLSDAEEFPALRRIEDGLTELMEDAAGAWPIGHLLSGGRSTHAYYCPPSPVRPFDPTLAWDPYTVEMRVHDDPEWAFLREDLAPDASERRQIASLRQTAVLKGHGDDITAERMVDWTITLPDDAAVARAAEDLAAAGYRVAHPAGLVVEATRSHSLDLNTLVEHQEQVAEIAERHGGELDGWGSPIVSSPPPARRRGRRLRR